MDWNWWYSVIQADNLKTIVANGGTKVGLTEYVYCGILFAENGSEECPGCVSAFQAMARLQAEEQGQ